MIKRAFALCCLAMVAVLSFGPWLAGGTMVAADSPTTSSLYSAWGTSSSDVFAAGADGTILHYDGESWTVMSSGTTNALYGVWGSSSSDVFAVGAVGTILHYDGVSWSTMDSGTINDLHDVWGSGGNDVFAVGDPWTILHWDGVGWASMQDCIAGYDEYDLGFYFQIHAVWGTSASNVFAAGSMGGVHSDAEGNYNSPIMHFDGSEWRPMNFDDITTLYDFDHNGLTVEGMWGCSDGTVWAVCANPYYGVGWVLEYSGGVWSRVNTGQTMPLYAIWGTSCSNVFAVGGQAWGGSQILHYDGTCWWSTTIDDAVSIEGVWVSPDNDVFTAADGGTVAQFDGEDNTPAGTGVRVTCTGPSGWQPLTAIVTEGDVTDGGSTSVALGPCPGFRVVPRFEVLGARSFDITTTATYLGNIAVSITYDDTEMSAEEESALRMMHYEAGGWVDVTGSLDTSGNVVTGTVSSLSQFVLAYAVADITACDSSGSPTDEFAAGQTVYVKGAGLEANTSYKIWIQDAPVGDGDALVVGEDPSGTQEVVTTDEDGQFGLVGIWTIPIGAAVGCHRYDIVVDGLDGGDGTGRYGPATDGIAGIDVYHAWDINHDCKVNYKDLAIIGAHYGCCLPAACYHTAADINGDGCVDYKDLAMLGAHYGESYQ